LCGGFRLDARPNLTFRIAFAFLLGAGNLLDSVLGILNVFRYLLKLQRFLLIFGSTLGDGSPAFSAETLLVVVVVMGI
jgi:hypothetical protein